MFSLSAEALCDYQINQVSPYFFSANVTVTNTGPVDVTNWDVTLGFTDATNISNAFISNGNYSLSRSGSGPFTIAAQGGGGNSGTLSVGGSVVLTVQGQGGTAILASLTGSLCNFAPQNQSLTIVKEIINDDGGTAEASDFGISTTAGTVNFGTPTGSGTLADPLVYTSSPMPVPADDTYSLTELDAAGYTEGTWSCSGNSGGVANAFDAGKVEIFKDEDVVCTITNNDDAGAFSGMCEHTINSFFGGFNGTIEITNTGVLPINGWEVDWSYSDGSVINNSYNVVRTGSNPYTGSNVGSDFGFNGNIPVGGSVVFGFSGSGGGALGSLTGPYCGAPSVVQTATLTLAKVVNNTAGGGSAVSTDWTLEANIDGGAAEISGTSGVSGVVEPGDYVLSELNGPGGYVLQNLVCDSGILNASNNTLTLAPGDNSLCTFTNRDLAVDLEITKTVNNATPNIGDIITFTLTIVNNGPDQATNVTVNDTINSGFSFVANSMLGGDSQNQSAPGLAWVINSIPAGAGNVAILNYQVTVLPP